MSWEISWADMCRACMEADGTLLSLYDEESQIGDNDLPDKLAELASIEVSKSDGLPSKLCGKCVDKINSYFEFKYLVQESDKKLRHMFNAQVVCDIKNDSEIRCDKQQNLKIKNEFYFNKGYKNYSIEEKDTRINDNCHSDNVSMLDSVEEQVIDNSFMEDFETTAILKVEENIDDVECINNEIQGLHVILNSDELNSISSNSESKIIENDNKIYQTFSCKIKNIETVKQKDCSKTLRTSQFLKEITKESDIFENCNISNDTIEDDGDSDCVNILEQENIIGSLNDTVTKVKEIRETGKPVEFQCTLCSQNYGELSEVLCHLVDLHVPISGPFYCIVCEKDCDNIKELKSHVKTHKGPSPYTCFLCNKGYVMKRYLKRHMSCHTDFPRYRCSKCGKRFKVKNELETHVQTHTQGAPFKCSQCPRQFNHKGNYKRHLISHLDPQGQYLPKYPCSICKRRFLNNRTLITHMRVHTGEKPFHCNICGKSFSQHGNLLNHQKIHTNPRSFRCDVCGKTFNQKSTLKDHSLLHSGEKPYICTVCGSAFTFSAALRRHMWTHSGGRPFECDVCNAKFIGRYDLKRHMKIHNRKPKLECPKPNKEQESDLVEVPEEIINVFQDPTHPDTIFVEQIFLCDDSVQIVSQDDSEKENVESLLGLIEST